MIEFFKYLFRPSFWFQNYKTETHWDLKLKNLIESGKKIKVNQYTIEIDGYSIWIANFPYAYGHLVGLAVPVLPKRSTRERLQKFVLQKKFEEIETKEAGAAARE